MTVSAVTRANLWDSANFPGSLTTQPRPHGGGTVTDGKTDPFRPADDSYTPGAGISAHSSVQAPHITASNAVNPAGPAGSNSSVNAQAALVNGIPLSLLGGASSGSSNGSGQTQAGTSSTGDGGVLSQLESAISAAAADGSQDSNWMNDLVSYASGLDGAPSSVGGGSSAGGVLSSDLSTIEQVIQRVTSQVSSALAAQGASPGLLSAAVNALRTSLTLNSLGAVAQQIAARTGSQDNYTVTSSVVTISANNANTVASVAGQTESFSGAGGNVSFTSTSGTASATGAGGDTGNGTSLNAEGFGYRFAISESGPDGSAYAGTSEVSAAATAASNNGAGGSASATAAVEEDSTVYESASGSSSANNNAMVLMSDWEANLESTATQNTPNTDGANSSEQAQPAGSGARSMSDLLNGAAHVLFKQALAMLEGLFGVGSSNAASETGLGQLVDVYA
jgi:hypothetical protein